MLLSLRTRYENLFGSREASCRQRGVHHRTDPNERLCWPRVVHGGPCWSIVVNASPRWPALVHDCPCGVIEVHGVLWWCIVLRGGQSCSVFKYTLICVFYSLSNRNFRGPGGVGGGLDLGSRAKICARELASVAFRDSCGIQRPHVDDQTDDRYSS